MPPFLTWLAAMSPARRLSVVTIIFISIFELVILGFGAIAAARWLSGDPIESQASQWICLAALIAVGAGAILFMMRIERRQRRQK